MTTLPEPHFIDRDPEAITREIIAAYEAETGRTLQPAQVERLIADMVAYRESLTRIAAQEVGKQNLLSYARFPMLDHLGELVGVERLAAQAARTTLRFSLSAAQAFDVTVPQGTRVRSKDGAVTFATDAPLTIAAGATTGEAPAAAAVAGTAGNGYLQGEVAELVDPVAYVAGATNTTVTNGGADTETDDRLRGRIRQAPHAFSIAGPEKAYRARAMEAHQGIIDVAVLSPTPGDIEIRPLMRDGLPSAEVIDLVQTHLSGEKLRPLGDAVAVLAPEEVPFTIDVSVTRFANTDATALQAAVEAALQTEVDRLRGQLGLDIVPRRFTAAAMGVAGVYDAALAAPAAVTVLAAHQVARCDGITVTVTGEADG